MGDPTATFDQLKATLRDLADVIASFRDALVERGVPQTRAEELVTVWFEYFLDREAER
jgi:anti-sigma regulatory factor (Ser/Thr protein kinase)